MPKAVHPRSPVASPKREARPSGVRKVAAPDPRKCWRPKLKELPEQCISCPFRTGNDKEFGEIVAKLRAAHGLPAPTKADVGFTRINLRLELKHSGDFICHGTAYTPAMAQRDPSCHRQCPGATAYFLREK